MAVNKATEGTWKSGSVSHFKVLDQHSPEVAEESHKIFYRPTSQKAKIRSKDIRTGK
jgi:hypothetical protein